MVKLYFAKTDSLCDPALFSELYLLMPEDRREKIDRLKNDNDKRLSLAAGVLNSLALLLNPGCQTNLSHSGKIALCAFGDSDVGCDVEEIKEANLKIAKRFFAPSEYDALCKSSEPNELFYRLWTAKEAFMKCTKLGFSLPMSKFEIDVTNGYSLTQSVNDKEYHFREYKDIPGYAVTCCSLSDEFCDIEEIDLETLLRE